jgi:hypothetical protein
VLNPPATSHQFAAELINTVDATCTNLTTARNGRPSNLTFEQAAAATQLMALNAIAASLLAVADAIAKQKH